MLKILFALFAISFGLASNTFADSSVQSPHVKVTLLSEHNSFHHGTNWIGIRFELDPEWHVYWKNPGDSGAAPRFTFTLPEGVTASDLYWPVPKRIPISHLMNFGYEESVVLLAKLSIPDNYARETVPIKAAGEWLVCKEDCIPGEGEVSLMLQKNAVPIDRASSLDFEIYRGKLPKVYDGDPLILNTSDSSIQITLPKKLQSGTPFFLPEINGIIKNAATQTLDESGVLSATKESPALIPDSFDALIIGDQTTQVKISYNPPLPPQEGVPSLLILLVFAFIGGIILNLMPCVLPVIGIKVFSLIEHAQDSARLRRHYGLLFLLGVLLSLWAIWLAVMIARSIGMSLGWGFQLQEPWFVLSLVVVLTLIGLNLLGAFEVGATLQRIFGTKKANSPSGEALLSGFLTTIVATPCTAPFMGTSVAVALTTDLVSSFLIFTFLGLGLGIPYVAFCISPTLMQLLPKPGMWMVRLKQFFALPLFATAAWLVWIFSLQVGAPTSSEIYTDRFGQHWEKFSEEKIQSLRNDGRTIYVDYTAAWCITCQVNKQVVFSSDKVRSFIQENGIVLVRADWTNGDPDIERSIKSFGKAGVPLNIVYKSGTEPKILPNILTPYIVLDSLK